VNESAKSTASRGRSFFQPKTRDPVWRVSLGSYFPSLIVFHSLPGFVPSFLYFADHLPLPHNSGLGRTRVGGFRICPSDCFQQLPGFVPSFCILRLVFRAQVLGISLIPDVFGPGQRGERPKFARAAKLRMPFCRLPHPEHYRKFSVRNFDRVNVFNIIWVRSFNFVSRDMYGRLPQPPGLSH